MRRFRERLGNPMEWSVADKCLLFGSFILLFTCLYAAALYNFLLHPQIAPFVNESYVLDVVFPVTVYCFVGGWLVIVLSALVLRYVAPQSRALIHPLAQLYAVGFALASYWQGHFTSLFTGVTLFSGFTVGLMIFERRFMLWAAVSYFAVVVGTTVAEQLAMIPYAPALIASPFQNGRLAPWWLANVGGVTFVLLLAIVMLIDYIIKQSHDRARALAHATDELARANDVISRYVAA